MITVKQLLEYLTDDEKVTVSKWPRSPKSIKATDHYFGKGIDDKIEHLEGSIDKSEVHKQIERHLGKEIHSDEYKEGKTTDEYGRQVRIGKLLDKHKAPDDIKRGFENDSTRQAKSAKGLTVRTTRSAEGVAGQTSHGQSWENGSCKNFNTGSNKSYLKPEVKHGTVVSYLHDDTGKEIARCTHQPYLNDKGHTAYAVDSHYGIDHAGFKKHCEGVSKALSGEHKGGSIIYNKHKDVYDDSGENFILHPNATKEHLDKAINDDDVDVRAGVANHPNATKEHLDKALNDKEWPVRQIAAEHPNATKEHLDKALNDKEWPVRESAAKNKNATKEHLDKALNDKNSFVQQAVASHPNATKEHLDKALNSRNVDIRRTAVSHPNATKEHLDKALNDKDTDVRMIAASHPNATKEHLDKALNDKDADVRTEAISHPNATKEHIAKALDDKDSDVRRMAKSRLDTIKESKMITVKQLLDVI